MHFRRSARVAALWLASLASLLPAAVLGYPEGAPDTACSSMTPQHSTRSVLATSRTDYPPYELVLPDSGCFKTGQHVQLTFRKVTDSIPDFKGVFIEARKAKDPDQNVHYGTYNVDDTNLQLVQCEPNHNNAITHKSATPKNSETFTWTAPSQLKADVVFRFTVVQSRFTFWANQQSAKLEYDPQCSGAAGPITSLLLIIPTVTIISLYALH